MQISEPDACETSETEDMAPQALSHEAVDLGDGLSAANDAPTDLDELEEMEIDGRRHLIPKALKGGFLMHADYTRCPPSAPMRQTEGSR